METFPSCRELFLLAGVSLSLKGNILLAGKRPTSCPAALLQLSAALPPPSCTPPSSRCRAVQRPHREDPTLAEAPGLWEGPGLWEDPGLLGSKRLVGPKSLGGPDTLGGTDTLKGPESIWQGKDSGRAQDS